MKRTLCLVVLLACAASAPAADARDAARATLASAGDSVVAVRLVVKVKLGMQGQTQDLEEKLEANAIMIDPTGLAVTSAAALDPTSAAKGVLSRMGQQAAAIQIDSEVKEAVVLLPGGVEAEADVVLTDKDLDLSFVRLRDRTLKPTTASLAKAAAQAKPLDDIFVLGRTDKAANRTALAAVGLVRCHVKGPQPYYLVDGDIGGNLGCLVYAADGAPLGLVVTKAVTADPGGNPMLTQLAMMGNPGGAQPARIVRPIDQIVELVAQAQQVAAPAKDEKAPAKDEKKDAKTP